MKYQFRASSMSLTNGNGELIANFLNHDLKKTMESYHFPYISQCNFTLQISSENLALTIKLNSLSPK